ncbi:hypothetical protein [Rathayibacter sp. VKM Ac-2760]|uniref:hypothetical protein n=1 Tax=Rathayibacter sp. VKM Ac-2760 TaxID=2609253 RepID=UPI001316394F|nr:hypothetical protein [Rathayibacter sp. VKM Ac-2760]QHC57344.1 hypothetical protein GSU72_01185 [Rathayibacter sp. VKM Ac-2760]
MLVTAAGLDDARTSAPENARELVLHACRAGDAELQSHIDDLWAAKADPEQTRELLARYRREVEDARTLLAAAAEPQWWRSATAERIEESCRAARIWAEGDPVCADLERAFAARLRSVLGIDLAQIPRHERSR